MNGSPPRPTLLNTVKNCLQSDSALMGKKLVARLISLQDQFRVIGDVRGLGLMVATEFITPSGEPDKQTADAVRNKCLEDGLILLTCGSYSNVIRWIPPLNIKDTHLEEALNIFQRALEGTWR